MPSCYSYDVFHCGHSADMEPHIHIVMRTEDGAQTIQAAFDVNQLLKMLAACGCTVIEGDVSDQPLDHSDARSKNRVH